MSEQTPIRTVFRGGNRYYFDQGRPDTKYPGVTGVVGMLPMPFLAPWNGKMTAELAIDSIDFVKAMAENDREGAVDYLKGAARRYTKIRADIGSKAHDLFERMVRGEGRLTVVDEFGDFVVNVHPDMVPYRRHFAEFLRDVNPELIRAEDVAWSDTHAYAGSFDAILRVWLDENNKPTPDRTGTPYLVIVDWKTSKGTYASVALQMSAYAHADWIIDPDGTREPMPEFDGAFVLHITDKAWDFIPVRIDRDDVFAYFLHLRHSFTWDRDVSKTVLGKAIAGSKIRLKALVTGTERRAR